MPLAAPDLAKQPPRSPRVRLGGYAVLPRILDKGRATIAGKAGEYKFGCPLDQRFLQFVGIKAPDVKKQIDWRIGITGLSLAKAAPAGVKIAFGTDAGVSKHGRNADEFELMVKYGMSPVEAIKAATVNAADLLGLSSEVGTIEPGKSADLIAVAGDPLADVRVLKSVVFVMARGEVVKD